MDEDERSEVLSEQNQSEALTNRTAKRVARLKKYLVYAVGEILLVVIGILIALQINNWNEYIKENDTELQYLDRLLVDIQVDTSYYNKRIGEAERIMLDLYAFIHEAYEIQETHEEYKNLLKHLAFPSQH